MLTEKERDLEIWADIEGYEGLYQVSHLGRVKSLGRVVKRTDGTIQTFKERILKPRLDGSGYSMVMLYVEGKGKNIKIHRLVAKAFISNVNNKPQVNHINAIKTDNRISNLEWCTNSENQKHAYNNGLNKSRKGTKNHNNKLTESDVLEIRNSNLMGVELAKIYGVSDVLISRIKLRKTWKHI